jgi:hypothetical protein
MNSSRNNNLIFLLKRVQAQASTVFFLCQSGWRDFWIWDSKEHTSKLFKLQIFLKFETSRFQHVAKT